jgi:ribosomal protein S18 acetylase RimI-like enzyme
MTIEGIEIRRLGSPAEPDFEGMTFPLYRRLLSLEPTVRHPEQGDPKAIRPVAIGAWRAGLPVGLLIAEVPAEAGTVEPAELLSLFVAAEERRRGIGAALVEAAENELAAAGAAEVRAVWTAGKPAIAWLERILERRGWAAPEPRTVSARFRPEAMLTLPLFSPKHLAALDPGFDIFPWSEIPAAELERIRATHEARPWISEGLEPWSYGGGLGYDPATSVGARHRGEVVGWVLTERIDDRLLRMTVSFLHKRLSRRGRIVPLYKASLERAVASGYEFVLFVTPVRFPNMVRFIHRWIARRADFVGETRGAGKSLLTP